MELVSTTQSTKLEPVKQCLCAKATMFGVLWLWQFISRYHKLVDLYLL
jgi:hypothetical protein